MPQSAPGRRGSSTWHRFSTARTGHSEGSGISNGPGHPRIIGEVPTWIVRRTWRVESKSATGAIEEARPGEHDEMVVERIEATEHIFRCRVCGHEEAWTTEDASVAASVRHLRDAHGEHLVLDAPPDPESLGRRFEDWERQS